MCATWNRNSYLDAVYTTELTNLSYLLLILDVFAFLASWRIMRLCFSVYDTIYSVYSLIYYWALEDTLCHERPAQIMLNSLSSLCK